MQNQPENISEFLNLLPEIVFEIDSDLKVKFLNESFEKNLGYSIADTLNKKIELEKVLHPGDLERIKNSLFENFKGNLVTGNSYSIYDKWGKLHTLEMYNSHIIKNNKIVGLRCIAIDITEKQEFQKKLEEKEEHYRQIYQNSPIPYHSLDINAQILDINPAWEKVMRYSRNEVIGKNFSLFVSENHQEKFSKSFTTFKDKGDADGVELELITKDKRKIWANFYGKAEYTYNRQFYKSHCMFNDITLQKKSEQTLIDSEHRLRELNATKDKFFSIIAHDLKNPFNDLMGFTQLLALNIDKYDKSKIEQFVKIIHQSSRLAYNLLENLLDWSRAQTGTLKFNPEKININKLIEENIELLESTARNKNIKIYSELSNDLNVIADKNMVRTIIRNLVSNAIKYTNQGGIIKIQNYIGKDYCELSIVDNGIGISPEYIDKLFKIDESFSTIGTEREKGTGLGLILCKEFVEKNGGELWVKSQPNKGSTFTFTLPLPEPEF